MRSILIALAIALPLTADAQGRRHVTDEVDRFMLNHFDRIQPKSISENLEYCGLVAFDADGVLRVTQARRGTEDSCDPGSAPQDWEVIASYHTHGAFMEDADSEVPSSDDLQSDIAEDIDGYVATPGGRVWLNVADERLTFQLCGRGCVKSDPKARQCKSFTPRVEYTLRQLREREEKEVVGC